jgi:hypothetical protein
MKKYLSFSIAIILLYCCSLAFADLSLNSNVAKSTTATNLERVVVDEAKTVANPSMSTSAVGPAAPVFSGVSVSIPQAQADEIKMKEMGKANRQQGGQYPADPRMILQGGEDIATATPIASLPHHSSGTTIGYAHNYDAVCPYGPHASPDVVYSYAPSSNEVLDLTLCMGNTDYDSKMFVYENDETVLVGCSDDACTSPVYPDPYVSRIAGMNVYAGNTYYIVIDGYGGEAGNYVLDVSAFVPPTCTPDLSVSIPAALPYSNANTTCGMVNDFDQTCLGFYDGGEDIIYEIVVTSDVCVDLNLDPGTDGWTGMAIDYSCPPNPSSCIAVSTNSGASPHGIYGVSLAAGTYYVMIDTWPTPDCIANFTFSMSECSPAPPNDECVNATPVNVYPSTQCGTNIGATVDCPGVLDWNATWFALDAPNATNNVSVNFCGTQADIQTVGIVLYADCFDCNAYIIANSYMWQDCPDGFFNPSLFWENLPGPATYYFPVYAGTPMDYCFDVNVTADVPCDVVCPGGTPENEPACYDEYVDVTNGGCNSDPNVFGTVTCGETICAESGTYLFTGLQYRDTDWFLLTLTEDQLVTVNAMAEFDLQMFFIQAPCPGIIVSSAAAADCVPLTMTSLLTAGDWYVWAGPQVFTGIPCGANPGSEYWFTVTCEDPPPPPANDLCADAIPLAFPASVQGSTFNGTMDSEFPTCGTTISGPGVWYTIQGTGNTMTATTCNAYTAYDTKLNIYCGGCETPVCITGNDDNCVGFNGLNSTVTWCSDATATYQVLVQGFGGQSGAFQLDIYDDGTPCGNPISCVPIPAPPNDNCGDVTPVQLNPGTPLQFAGDNTGATVDCPGLGWAEVWEAITTSECMDITIDYCGTAPAFSNVFIVVADACPCGAFVFANNWDDLSCDGNWTVRFTNIQPGTYWIPVLTDPPAGVVGPYVMNVSGVACPPPPPNPCDDSEYINHSLPGANVFATQCDPVYPFQAGVADDFILPGGGTTDIGHVVIYAGFWNGPLDPNNVSDVQVTIYADNAGVPGGRPVGTDPTCAHEEDIAGGIISSELVGFGNFTFTLDPGLGIYSLEIDITDVTLQNGTTYWLEVAPVLDFSVGGQCGWAPSDLLTGNSGVQIFEFLGITEWGPPSGIATDFAFCLHAAGGGGACAYVPGDINGNDQANGIDVTYGVGYFKGGAAPPIICTDCPNPGETMYAGGDVNGNCAFNGIDITFFVSYLKGGQPALLFCPTCPPARLGAPSPETPSLAPSKIEIRSTQE